MDWEEYISEIATDIMKEQSPKRFPLQHLTLSYYSVSKIAATDIMEDV